MKKIRKHICRLMVGCFLLTAGAFGTGFDADAKSGTWKKDSGGYYYSYLDGTYAKNEWVKTGSKWYYLNASGYMQTGWKKIGGKWYFFKKDGSMAAGEYCQGYWLNKDGTCTYSYKATWRKNKTGWWYGDAKGWYAKNQWLTIDGKEYYFYKNGYVAVKQWIGNYYVDENGVYAGTNPKTGAKKTVSYNSLPKQNELYVLLKDYDFDCVFDPESKYDCKEADTVKVYNLLSGYYMFNDTILNPEYIEIDPRGVYSDPGPNTPCRIKQSTFEWGLRTIMNVPAKDVKKLMNEYFNSENDWKYIYDGYIYFCHPIFGEWVYDVKDRTVKTDGVYYYFSYTLTDDLPEYGYYDIYGDEFKDTKIEAVLSYKYENGEYFWSLYSLKCVN